ncbi:DrmE family protein [Bacillus subtilis]
MRGLTDNQRNNAFISILPKAIDVSNNDIANLGEFLKVANEDLARGMLNHERFCLVESLGNVDGNLHNEEKILTSQVDNILLTASLRAFHNSKKKKHEGDILFVTPPLSYSFSLLIAYHLILQHLASNLSGNKEFKFKEGKGVLIISDNIELLSRIWRTNINGTYLREYLNIFTIQAGKFNNFSFSEDSSLTKKSNKDRIDDSLPWLSFYRAFRKELPRELEREPEVIIIDLLPLLHRSRAKALLEWASVHSDHVIVIAPTNDDISNTLASQIRHCVPIDMVTLDSLKGIFNVNSNIPINPISASWSLQSSIKFLAPGKVITINNLLEPNDLNKESNRLQELLKLSLNKNNEFGVSVRKLRNIVYKILSLTIPLQWYERARLAKGLPTLKELIYKFSKIPAESMDDKVIGETILPHLLDNILSIYGILIRMSDSPRGHVLQTLLHKAIREKNKVLIIVDDQLVAEELKIWLRSKMDFALKDFIKISVMTQGDWAKKQLKEIYFDEQKEPELLIITNPWNVKYLSSFYFSDRTEVHFISLNSELPLLKYQLNKISSSALLSRYQDTFKNLFSLRVPVKNNFDKPKIELELFNYKMNSIKGLQKISNKVEANLNNLFSDEVLIQILTQNNETIDDELNVVTDFNETYQSYLFIEKKRESFIPCVKLHLVTKEQSEGKYAYVPINTKLPVKKFDEEEVKDVNPLEVKNGDIWVKVKKQQRKELFNAILDMASNTLVMNWIDVNVNEWKEMLEVLWYKYHVSSRYKIETYEKIKTAVNANGGKVISSLTISKWINGEVSLVRDYENVMAVARVLGDEQYLNRAKSIYKAMRELWSIHIKLGKSLGKLVNKYAASLAGGYGVYNHKWMDLGKDIRISVPDILGILDFVELKGVITNKEYNVYESIILKTITAKVDELYMERGLVLNGENS